MIKKEARLPRFDPRCGLGKRGYKKKRKAWQLK
jgi:hypothetical protein